MDGLSGSLLKGRFSTALPRGGVGKMTIFKGGLRKEVRAEQGRGS